MASGRMVLITEDLKLKIVENALVSDFHVLQKAIGGNLEFFGLQLPNGLFAYCDEEGRYKYNETKDSQTMRERLSLLFQKRSPSVLGPILLTNTDEEGETVGLTDEQLDAIKKCFAKDQ